MSLPDYYCIALAPELGGEVVTSNRGEFDPIAVLGIVPITFGNLLRTDRSDLMQVDIEPA